MADISDDAAWARGVAVVAVLLGVMAVAWGLRAMYLSVAPLWLVPRGEYARARDCYLRTRASLLGRLTPGTRIACDYGVALTLHLEGDHDASLTALRGIPRGEAGVALGFAIDTAAAWSLLLSGGSAAEASARLASARAVVDGPDLALAHAVAATLAGDTTGAASAVADADGLAARSDVRWSRQAIVRRDATMVAESAALMRGWLHALRGEHDDARPHLLAAALSAHPVTREKARGLLTTPPEDEPPPSSLRPIVR